MNRERFRRTTGPLSVETAGKTVDEAIQAALGRLRARRDEVDVEVLQEGRSGLFGIGSREARVRVRRHDRTEPKAEGRPERRPSVGTGDSGGRRGLPGGRRASEDIARLEREVEKHRTARGAGPREARGAAMGSTARSVAPTSGSRRREPVTGSSEARTLPARGDSTAPRRRSSGGGRPVSERHTEPRTTPPPRSSVARSSAPLSEPSTRPSAPATVEPSVLAEFAQGILRRMGYTARVEAAYTDEAYEVRIDAGENNEILIGKKGETLDALQHVLAKMASRGLEELLRVRVDIAEYRQKRSTELSERALEMARQVLETGHEIITEPLPAAERRSIHRALSDHPEVTTQSLGDGQVKPVWVGLKSAKPSMSDVAPVVVRRGGASHSTSGRSSVDSRARELRGEESAATAPARSATPAPVSSAALAPRSLIDPWDSTPANNDKSSSAAAPEWGRRPKPAKGRRK